MNLLLIGDNFFSASMVQRLRQLGLSAKNQIVCTYRSKNQYTHLDAHEEQIPFIPLAEAPHSQLPRPATDYKKIILFNLYPNLAPWVAAIPKGPEVIWGIFEPAYMSMASRFNNLLGPRTSSWAERRNCVPLAPKSIPDIQRRAIARVDAFTLSDAHSINDIRTDFGIETPKTYDFSFPFSVQSATEQDNSFPQHLSFICDKSVRIILLGNSSVIYNNYIDIIDMLKNMKFPSDVIFVAQLAYGADTMTCPITQYGKEHLGETFIPMQEALSEPLHNTLLRNSTAAIMAGYYHLGGLTIKKLLYYGKKVFLSSQNPMFGSYKESLDSIGNFEELTPAALLTPLTEEEKARQQLFITTAYGQKKNDEHLFRLFS